MINNIKHRLHPASLLGFGVASAFAVIQNWSLPEFGWSTWLAGLIFSYTCVLAWIFHFLLNARSQKTRLEQHLPFLGQFSPETFWVMAVPLVLLVAWLAFRIYTFVFGFYGLFLSVFAEMEPLELFGRNGFINSDFFTPVIYLVRLFWPMVLGTLILNIRLILKNEPWRGVFLPVQFEILRIHILTLALPILSLIAWMLFKNAYQSVTIILLMAIFYLLPANAQKSAAPASESTDCPFCS